MGNHNSAYKLGCIYSKIGINVLNDFAKAADYFQRASDIGNLKASFKLALMHVYGKVNNFYLFYFLILFSFCFYFMNKKGIPKNVGKGIEILENASKMGGTDSTHYLGTANMSGKIIPKNYSKAISYLEKNCQLGIKKSLHCLALIYQNGDGVEVDLNKAFNLFKRASDLNFYRSICSLAGCYESGSGN